MSDLFRDHTKFVKSIIMAYANMVKKCVQGHHFCVHSERFYFLAHQGNRKKMLCEGIEALT